MNASLRAVPLLVALLLAAHAATASAQSSDDARKAARRAQLQMQNLQQQAQDAQAAKTKAESDKAAADKQIAEQNQQLSRIKGALPQAQKKLKEVETERDGLAARVAALEQQLAEQKRVAEANAGVATRQLKVSGEWRDEVARRYDAQVATGKECRAKNTKLVALNAELLDRYRGKSFGDVMKQRDPVLGLGEVETFNLVQAWRDRADAERVAPAAETPPLPPMPEVKLPSAATTEGKTAP
jgi:chromosome segregation ATPase